MNEEQLLALTIDQLKVLSYDASAQIRAFSNDIRILESIIQRKLAQPVEKPAVVIDAKK